MAETQNFTNIRRYRIMVHRFIKLSAEIKVKNFIASVRNYLHNILLNTSFASK